MGLSLRMVDLSPCPSDQGVPMTALARLKEALLISSGRSYRIVPDDPAKGNLHRPILQVRIEDVMLDSLEGMHFASIRASVRLPGMASSVEVTGKAGHADTERALSRAVLRFIAMVERLPLQE